MRLLILTFTAFVAQIAGAVENSRYVFRLDRTKPEAVRAAAVDEIRRVVVAHGGRLLDTGGLNGLCEMPEAAVGDVKAIAGVKIVEAEITYHPLEEVPAPGVRTFDNVDYNFALSDGLSAERTQAIVDEIQRISREQGSGVVTFMDIAGVGTANLTRQGVAQVRAIAGVTSIEPARTDHRTQATARQPGELDEVPQPGFRTSDNVDYVFGLNEGLSAQEIKAVLAEIRRVSAQQGSGVVEYMDLLGVGTVNLTSLGVEKVRAIAGVNSLELARTDLKTQTKSRRDYRVRLDAALDVRRLAAKLAELKPLLEADGGKVDYMKRSRLFIAALTPETAARVATMPGVVSVQLADGEYKACDDL